MVYLSQSLYVDAINTCSFIFNAFSISIIYDVIFI